jgi:hypothetical protein
MLENEKLHLFTGKENLTSNNLQHWSRQFRIYSFQIGLHSARSGFSNGNVFSGSSPFSQLCFWADGPVMHSYDI